MCEGSAGGASRASASGVSETASSSSRSRVRDSSSWTASRSVPSGASTISIIVKRPPSTAIWESVMFSEWPSSARVTSATMPGRSRPIAERASCGMGRIVTNVLEILSRDPELLVMEQSYNAGAEAPPPHYHPSQDEHFEVLEGSIALRVGHEHRTVPAGESFDIPRGTVHTMGPAGGPARVRWEVRPALRTEAFLTEMPEAFEDLLAHVQRHAAEIRLAGF